jgi:hypothetical protein
LPLIATSSELPVRSSGPLAQIDPGRAILNEADRPIDAHEILGACDRTDVFLKHSAVAFEAGGVEVGDVVGDHIQFAR